MQISPIGTVAFVCTYANPYTPPIRKHRMMCGRGISKANHVTVLCACTTRSHEKGLHPCTVYATECVTKCRYHL